MAEYIQEELPLIYYLDGVLVGGYTGGNLLHVSGSIYTNGMVSGYIDENGNLQQGGDVRLYRIRKDWETSNARPGKARCSRNL